MLHCEDHWHKFTVMETFTVCRSLILSTFSPSQPAAFTRPSLTHTSCTSSPSSFLKGENWRTHTHAPQAFPLLQRLKICVICLKQSAQCSICSTAAASLLLSLVCSIFCLFFHQITRFETVTYLFTPVKLRSS